MLLLTKSKIYIGLLLAAMLTQSFLGKNIFPYIFTNPEQVMDFKSNNNIFEIKVTQQFPKFVRFPTFLGKIFLDKFLTIAQDLKRDHATDRQVRFILDTPENVQFLLYYITLPPADQPEPLFLFHGGFPPANVIPYNWKYQLTPNSNPYHLFNFFSTGNREANGDMKLTFFHSDFGTLDPIEAPIGIKSILMKRIIAVQDSFRRKLISGFQKEYTEFVNTFTENVVKKIKNTKEKYPEIIQDLLPNPNTKYVMTPIVFKPNEMLYISTDETTHIWYDSKKKELNIVDVGSRLLSKGLNRMITINDKMITHINIYMTHFHADHVQSLAGFIFSERVRGKQKIVLFIHSKLIYQFIGWVLENWTFIQEDGKFLFQLVVVAENTVFPGSDVVLPVVHHTENSWGFKHFITSISWIFHRPGKCDFIFTGDINPASKKIIEVTRGQLKEYFKQMFIKANTKFNSKCAQVFWDYGHFLPDTANGSYQPILKTIEGNYFAQFIYEHQKQNKCYILESTPIIDQMTEHTFLIPDTNCTPVIQKK